MPKSSSSRDLAIVGHESYSLTGPIGPIPLGMTPSETRALFIYTFTETIICDFLSKEDHWTRVDLPIPRSGNCRFPRGSVTHIHVMAWLCSVGAYYPFEAENIGWGIDKWEAHSDTYTNDPEGEYITVKLNISVGSKGSRLNRIGYTWIAFTSAEALSAQPVS